MITIWLVNCQRPFLTVEDPELIEIFAYLNPNVRPVKADTIKNSVVRLYNLGKKEMKVSFIIDFFFKNIIINKIK